MTDGHRNEAMGATNRKPSRRGLLRASGVLGVSAALGTGAALGDAHASPAMAGPASPHQPAEPNAATTPMQDPSEIPDGISQRKVLLFDLDGIRRDKLAEASTPNIDALAAAGKFGPALTHEPPPPTVSGPGHSTILTGVWPAKHGVVGNAQDQIEGGNWDQYPEFFTRLASVRPNLSTFAIANWAPLADWILESPDVKSLQSGASSGLAIIAWAMEAVRNHNPDVGYIYFIEADSAGHTYGGAAPEYLKQIEDLDHAIGVILAEVRARPTYGQEDWLFLATTDHGHLDTGGHGGGEPEVREIWTLASGGDITPGPSEAEMVDMVPTALAHLGIDIDPAWNLDGTPIT